MIPYNFCVLRYVHDGITGEFVNVGIAVFSLELPFLRARCTIQYGRITRMFDRIDGDRFKQTVRYVEDGVNRLGEKVRQQHLPFAEFPTTIEPLLQRVLPFDDSAIQFSKAAFGVSANLEATLGELFERYVERYAGPAEIPSRSDDEVWRVFRDAFERRRILSVLGPKTIAAPDYSFDFRAAWKNQVWHLYEPVSFDLVEPSSVLDKANRWVGRATNLNESSEPFRLHLLIGAPSNPKLDDVFKKANNILRKMAGNPELIKETEAEAFAAELEREINTHRDGSPRSLLDIKANGPLEK